LDFRKLNIATKKYSYSFPFTNEVINIIVGHEVYTFLDGFYGYQQISITLKDDKYKIIFVTECGAFVWVSMPFGVKNEPHTYQWVVTKAFREYVDVFMEIFLIDFIVFSDLSTHIKKFKKCFLTCVKSLALVSFQSLVCIHILFWNYLGIYSF
jgi:hypothetical protein